MIPDSSTKKIFFFKIGVVLIFLLFLAGIGLAQYLSNKEKNIGEDKIYPNVFINNTNVGGKSKDDVVKLFAERHQKLSNIRFTVFYKEEPIATYSGKTLGLKTDIKDVVERVYLVGRVEYLPSRSYQKLASILNFDKFRFKTKIVYNKPVINEFLQQSKERYNKPSKDALFKFENGRVTAFKPEENGIRLESEKFLEDFENSITDLKKEIKNKTLILRDVVIKPEVTLGEVNEFGIEELIGEGQSNYSGSIPERVHNLILAASRINGVLIPDGEEFSFNKSVGEISGLTGYKPAYIIKSGKTVLDDGGGVCQVSTTLFRTALSSGLPITARTAHAYRVGYYENDSKPGFDATVFSPSVDFRFKNDTGNAVLIETEIDQVTTILKFKFYGKKDGRKIYISDSRVWDVVPPLPEIRQDDPALQKGIIKQVDFPAWGAKASFDYKVIKNGKTIQEKTFFSNYRPWQAVYLIGTGEF